MTEADLNAALDRVKAEHDRSIFEVTINYRIWFDLLSELHEARKFVDYTGNPIVAGAKIFPSPYIPEDLAIGKDAQGNLHIIKLK